MSQATDQFHRALQGVDAMEAMVTNVQSGTALLAVVALDVENQAVENGILGPDRTHGYLSLLGRTPPLSYTAAHPF